MVPVDVPVNVPVNVSVKQVLVSFWFLGAGFWVLELTAIQKAFEKGETK